MQAYDEARQGEYMNDGEISSVAVLNEPVRRELYRYVVERGDDVTRDQAAAALHISRALAVFHLDRLAEEGLLEVSFRRLNEKRGPGAGRPSKLYRRSSRQLEVSLPPRRYELAARLLSTAVDSARSPETLSALAEVACGFGEALGREARARTTPRAATADVLTAAMQVLATQGFEPYVDSDQGIRLRNCPFHALAESHRSLICGMNLRLMEGFVRELAARDVQAVLDPQPGQCCVRFQVAEPPA
jgi:predicted ArsR family transcriptional regulator